MFIPVSRALKRQLAYGRCSITVGWITVAVDSAINPVETMYYMSVSSAGHQMIRELPADG